MVAQYDRETVAGIPLIRYKASRGDWGKIETLIQKEALVDNYIYTLEFERDQWKSAYEIN
jgi:hypothetical protein